MFHTPNLTGVRKQIIPKRINEGWGLQHIKLYGFDDELIMSGYNHYLDPLPHHAADDFLERIFQEIISPTGKTGIMCCPPSRLPITLVKFTMQSAASVIR
jgi:hypothetical protein